MRITKSSVMKANKVLGEVGSIQPIWYPVRASMTDACYPWFQKQRAVIDVIDRAYSSRKQAMTLRYFVGVSRPGLT